MTPAKRAGSEFEDALDAYASAVGNDSMGPSSVERTAMGRVLLAHDAAIAAAEQAAREEERESARREAADYANRLDDERVKRGDALARLRVCEEHCALAEQRASRERADVVAWLEAASKRCEAKCPRGDYWAGRADAYAAAIEEFIAGAHVGAAKGGE